jgi:hypothetical protein
VWEGLERGTKSDTEDLALVKIQRRLPRNKIRREKVRMKRWSRRRRRGDAEDLMKASSRRWRWRWSRRRRRSDAEDLMNASSSVVNAESFLLTLVSIIQSAITCQSTNRGLWR